MLKYTDSLDKKESSLLNHVYFDDDDVKKYMEKLRDVHDLMINYSENLSCVEANEIWMDEIMNINNEKPNNKDDIISENIH